MSWINPVVWWNECTLLEVQWLYFPMVYQILSEEGQCRGVCDSNFFLKCLTLVLYGIRNDFAWLADANVFSNPIAAKFSMLLIECYVMMDGCLLVMLGWREIKCYRTCIDFPWFRLQKYLALVTWLLIDVMEFYHPASFTNHLTFALTVTNDDSVLLQTVYALSMCWTHST